MHPEVIIDAEIEKKDIRPLCAAQLRYFFGNMPLLLVSGFFLIFVLYMTGFRFTMDTLHVIPLPLIVLLCIFLIFFTAILRGSRQSYKRSKMYLTRTRFIFSDENILVISKYGSSTDLWNEIDSVREAKYAFIISRKGKDEYVITRRSFSNQVQIDNFLLLLESHIGAGKLLLKHYALTFDPQNTQNTQNSLNLQNIQENAQENTAQNEVIFEKKSGTPSSQVEVHVSLSQKESLFFELGRYYKQVQGIIVNIIGFILLGIFIYDRMMDFDSLHLDIVILIIGCFLTFGIPVSLCLKSRRNYKKSTVSGRQQIFRFDEDYLCVESDNDTKKYRWNELTQFTKQKNGFIFKAKLAEDYQKRARLISKTSQKGYYVPARAFKTPEDIRVFEEIVKRNRGFISK